MDAMDERLPGITNGETDLLNYCQLIRRLTQFTVAWLRLDGEGNVYLRDVVACEQAGWHSDLTEWPDGWSREFNHGMGRGVGCVSGCKKKYELFACWM